jgi:hypothetical protein
MPKFPGESRRLERRSVELDLLKKEEFMRSSKPLSTVVKPSKKNRKEDWLSTTGSSESPNDKASSLEALEKEEEVKSIIFNQLMPFEKDEPFFQQTMTPIRVL